MLKKQIKKILLESKSKIKKSNILCIGDIMLDHYVYGNIYRISPEAPVPILAAESEFFQLGGVGNVSRNITNLGGNVSLLYLSGNDSSSKKINELLNNNKHIRKIKINVPNFRAPIKTRFINKLSHIIRVDHEDTDFNLANKYNRLIAIKLEKDATGNISIVRDDDKYEILHARSLKHVRLKRTTLLTESDFIFTADVLEQMTDENKTEWREYRKKLRDFPTAITTNIVTPVWPEKPTLAFK